jgi:hypothetical protein
MPPKLRLDLGASVQHSIQQNQSGVEQVGISNSFISTVFFSGLYVATRFLFHQLLAIQVFGAILVQVTNQVYAPSIEIGPTGTLKLYKSFQAFEFNNSGMVRNAMTSPLATGAAALQQSYQVRCCSCRHSIPHHLFYSNLF